MNGTGCGQKTSFFISKSNVQQSFRKCPKLRKCSKKCCLSTHKTLLYGTERTFVKTRCIKFDETNKIRPSNVSVVRNKLEKTPACPLTEVKGTLKIVEVKMYHPFQLRESSISVIPPAVIRWFPGIRLERWKCKAHLWHSQFAELPRIKPLTKKCRVEVDTGLFERLLPGSCVQTLCEENFKRWNQSIWCRIITIPVLALRAGCSEEVQLWRCRNDPRSAFVPLSLPFGLFPNRPKEYSKSHRFTGGLDFDWSTRLAFWSKISTHFTAVTK